jgi:hypothetical protein
MELLLWLVAVVLVVGGVGALVQGEVVPGLLLVGGGVVAGPVGVSVVS